MRCLAAGWVTQMSYERILLISFRLATRTLVALYFRKKNLICLAHGCGCEDSVQLPASNGRSRYTLCRVDAPEFSEFRTSLETKNDALQRQGHSSCDT